MELFAAPETSDCAHWTNRYETDTDSQWLTDITSNLFLAMAFSLSYFLEEPWTWIRILLIIGHALAAYLSVSRCQVTAFIWAVLLIAANVYRLLKTAYNNRPTRIPKYLQDMYNNLFKTYNISRPDFSTIIDKSRIHGIGPEESLYDDGHLRHDHVDLCILVSGKMTVWCDNLPIHTIYPGQFINSVEWTSVLRLQDNEDGHDFGWEQQVLIKPDEDSVYLRIYSSHLEWLKGHKGHLWRVLEAIVCKDVTRKLYQMNEGFERMIQQRERMEKKAMLKRLVHSLSLEALHVTSRGWNVSDNWLSADNRKMLLGCPHTSDGMPSKNHQLHQWSQSFSNLNEIHRAVNSNVAYLLRNSHSELVREWETGSIVIPSLRMQTLRIDPLSCRFRDDSIIRHYDWDQSWDHCGNCTFCKPLAEGETQVQQHPTVKH